ncbi:MAG TPA: hypothetical protein VJB05_01660 [archaeon]|nr:hypothetical protein [archaeon]
MTFHYIAFLIPEEMLTETEHDFRFPRGTLYGLENEGRVFYVVHSKIAKALLEAYRTIHDTDDIKPGLDTVDDDIPYASRETTDRASAEKIYTGQVIPRKPEGTD